MEQRHPVLRHNRIFRGVEETFNLEILLDPFEKEFYLPTLFVNFGYR